jgi:predicted N-acetyltransferase YhbS
MKFVYLADRPDFIPAVASWNYNQWGYLQAENSYQATVERLQNKLNRDKLPLPVIALDADDNIIASAQLKRYEIDTWPEREHWLGSVYVSESHRGHGIAGALCREMANIAHSLGIEVLYLQTEKLNGGLYTRLGWKQLETINHQGVDVCIMEKRLSHTITA